METENGGDKLQRAATEVAMVILARSLKSSSLEGKKFSGGSIKALSEKEEEEEEKEEEERKCVDLDYHFARFLRVEAIDDGWCWMDLSRRKNKQQRTIRIPRVCILYIYNILTYKLNQNKNRNIELSIRQNH